MRPLIPISAAIAFTGLLTPLALSFLLSPMFGFPILTCFASGAALSSTSLGTTLTVLAGSNIGLDLGRTKLGVALIGAAVADDVVAFVLAEIIHLLGDTPDGSSSVLGGAIGRAVGVAFGIGIVAVPFAIYVLGPALGFRPTLWVIGRWGSFAYLGIMILTLIGMVAAAGYAGTSPLYGAYVAGLMISYLSTLGDEQDAMGLETAHQETGRLRRIQTYPMSAQSPQMASTSTYRLPSVIPLTELPAPPHTPSHPNPFHTAFSAYLEPLSTYLLLPIFFGSIGFSLPFLRLWKGSIVWKGVVYGLLMMVGKALCGVWMFWALGKERASEGGVRGLEGVVATSEGANRGRVKMEHKKERREVGRTSPRLPPALLLGCAMVARGEIGLLIAQIGYHTAMPLLDEEAFLVAIWAIVLNTIIGPVGVSIVLKHYGKRVVGGGWE